MKINAYAKINWALNILGTRPDGYHEMDMLMQSIELHDELTIEPAGEISMPGEAPANLALLAARALAQFANVHQGARLKLRKRIPVRAGLGGGSADAAAALLALNQLWSLFLPMEQLMKVALSVGADVPFCLQGGTARVGGIGERIAPLSGGRPWPLLILHPGDGLSTPGMFQRWDGEPRHARPADIAAAAIALQAGDFPAMDRHARNMLTQSAVKALPAIGEAREALLRAGALFAAMSGSGSAVFGVFPTMRAARTAADSLGSRAILTKTKP